MNVSGIPFGAFGLTISGNASSKVYNLIGSSSGSGSGSGSGSSGDTVPS